MTISELMERLGELRGKYGDADVMWYETYDNVISVEVEHDPEGNAYIALIPY